MDYWEWLGKGVWYIVSLRWLPSLKDPTVEGLGGLTVFGGILSLILAIGVDGYWWLITAITGFLLFTHGIYRGLHKEKE